MLDGTFKLFLAKAGWPGGRVSTRLYGDNEIVIALCPRAAILRILTSIYIQCRHTEWTETPNMVWRQALWLRYIDKTY